MNFGLYEKLRRLDSKTKMMWDQRSIEIIRGIVLRSRKTTIKQEEAHTTQEVKEEDKK